MSPPIAEHDKLQQTDGTSFAVKLVPIIHCPTHPHTHASHERMLRQSVGLFLFVIPSQKLCLDPQRILIVIDSIKERLSS